MLQIQSKFIPNDSGVIQKGKIISTYNKKIVNSGDTVLISRKKFFLTKDLKKKYLGVISQTTKWKHRKSGLYLRSNCNKILLLKEPGQFLGSNFQGPFFAEIKKSTKFQIGFLGAKCI